MQLGPVIQDNFARNCGLGISLFERLVSAGIQPLILNIQYRMHPEISNFASLHFYKKQIADGVDAIDRKLKSD